MNNGTPKQPVQCVLETWLTNFGVPEIGVVEQGGEFEGRRVRINFCSKVRMCGEPCSLCGLCLPRGATKGTPPFHKPCRCATCDEREELPVVANLSDQILLCFALLC